MGDRILAAGAVALAAAYLYATSRLPSLDIGDPLGPKAFPVLLGVLLAAAGVLLFVESLRARSAVGEAAAGSTRPRAVLGAAAFTAVFFALLEPLGYLVALSAYLFAMTMALHGRKPVVCATTSVLFTLGSYALFVKVLGVALAKGLLHF